MSSTGQGGTPASSGADRGRGPASVAGSTRAATSTDRPTRPSPPRDGGAAHGGDRTSPIRTGQGTRTGQPQPTRDGSMARTGNARPGGGGAPGSGAARRPVSGQPRRRRGPRRVRLTLQRIDPWSVMKISFLVSVAMGIAGVIMVAVLWTVLSGMGVFADLNGLIGDITQGEGSGSGFDLMEYIGFGRVVSLAVVVGVIDVILLTAMATLGAFLYNICTSLVGGAQLTLSDE